MNLVSKSLVLFLVTRTTNAKLRAAPTETTLSEDSVFWSRHSMSVNLMNDSEYKPKEKITSFGQITEEDIPVLQKAWGDALVSISKTYQESGYDAAKELAQSVLDSAYCCTALVYQCCSSLRSLLVTRRFGIPKKEPWHTLLAAMIVTPTIRGLP